MALDAKVITYWHDHGIDLLFFPSIAVAENLWTLLKNETKLRLREAAIVTVSKRIKNWCRALDYAGSIEIAAHAGHDALLQAIHTHWHTLNRSARDSRRY